MSTIAREKPRSGKIIGREKKNEFRAGDCGARPLIDSITLAPLLDGINKQKGDILRNEEDIINAKKAKYRSATPEARKYSNLLAEERHHREEEVY